MVAKIAMPTGNRANFRLLRAEDFNTPVAKGAWASSPYVAQPQGVKQIDTYGKGWGDTAGKNWALNSGYDPAIIEVADSALIYNLAIYNLSVEGRATKPCLISANIGPKPPAAAQGVDGRWLYGRFEFAMMVEASAWLHKAAILFWPDSGIWPRDGEFDGPEAKTTDPKINFYLHFQNGTSGDSKVNFEGLAAKLSEEHWYAIDWTPDYVAFEIDGVRVAYYGPGVAGYDKAKIPNTPQHPQFQIEAAFDITNQQIADAYAAQQANAANAYKGRAFFHWYRMLKYEPGLAGDAQTPTPTPGNLVRDPLTVQTTAKRGELITATATYSNTGGTAVGVKFMAISLRGPNGERQDFAPAQGTPFTVGAGQSASLVAQTRIAADAAFGAWGIVSTWQGSDDVWHESTATPLTVEATPAPPPVPVPEPTPAPALPEVIATTSVEMLDPAAVKAALKMLDDRLRAIEAAL